MGEVTAEPPALQVTQPDTDTMEPPPQRGELPMSSSMGSDMPGTETEDEAFGLDRRRRTPGQRGEPRADGWTTLVGTTPSQAAPHITASLEADVRALGQPTQPGETEASQEVGGDNLPPTLPWTEQWNTQTAEGDSAHLELFYQNGASADSEGEAPSEASHRRRRLHAAGLN